MDTAQSHNSEKLITLKQAAERLNVSIETLLSWNHHNILKPTITQEGEVGYTQSQFDQFLRIRQAMHLATSPVSLPSTPLSQPAIQVQTPVVAHLEDMHNAPRIDTPRRSYSKSVLTFSVLVFLLTIALLPKPEGVQPYQYQQTYDKLVTNTEKVLSAQTSQMNLSEQIIAALPIQLKHEETADKNLHNENNDSVFKEKTTAPALYKQQPTTDDNEASQSVAMAKQKPTYAMGDVNLDEIGADSYTSTGFFQTEAEETSAIDEEGKIRGNADTKTIASVVGGIDQMVKSDSFKRGTTDANNQLLLVTLGAIAVLFALQRQFAWVNPTRKSHTPQSVPMQYPTVSPLPQRALEIDQKTDGTVVLIVLGKEYKISKPEMNSESDQFIEKLMTLAEGVKEIEYESGRFDSLKIATPLSRLVTRLGFVGIKRDLFFPRTSKNSVLFRRYLTQQDLADMNLSIDHILNQMDLLS